MNNIKHLFCMFRQLPLSAIILLLLSSCLKETAIPIASSFEVTIAVRLLVSFHIYSNISRLSLLARGNSLPQAYFYPCFALDDGGGQIALLIGIVVNNYYLHLKKIIKISKCSYFR